MTLLNIFKYIVLPILLITYLIYTVNYAKELEKSVLFSKRLRKVHMIMIWLIPFLWILIIKLFTRSTPGSYEIENKKENEPFFDVFQNN